MVSFYDATTLAILDAEAVAEGNTLLTDDAFAIAITRKQHAVFSALLDRYRAGIIDSFHADALLRQLTTLQQTQERLITEARLQGQQEGKEAVLHWLRGHSATKPHAPLWFEAATLADRFVDSETPKTSR